MKHRKLIAGLLALCCCAAPLANAYSANSPSAFSASAAEEVTADYKYTENKDGTITISKYTGTETEIVIPSEIGGKTVTALGINAFYGSSVKSVVMPDTITTVSNGIFGSCKSLESISISKNLTEISENMFSSCTKLNNVDVPDSVRTIGYSAFSGCTALAEIKLPTTMDSIDGSAFNTCAFSSFSLPDGITVIRVGTFNNCKNMKEISIPDSVTKIENNAFSNTGLPVDASGVLYADKWVIDYEGKLEELTIREGTIGLAKDSLLYSSFKKLNLPEGLKYINEGALHETYNLESINFPDSIVCIEGAVLGQNGFTGASKLLSSKEDFVIVDGWLLDCNLAEDVTEITVPDGVKGIYGTAFSRRKISKLTLPDGLINISNSAFSYCTMTAVNIPDSVKYIGKGAFANCENLEEVHLPEKLDAIADNLFEGCKKLTNINMPKTITTIGQSAFMECESLPEIIIPDSVTEISKQCFAKCRAAKNVQISKNLKTIPQDAFSYISAAAAVLPEGIEIIEKGAFSNSGLKYLSLPASLKSYGGFDYIGSSSYNETAPDILIVRNPETVLPDDAEMLRKSFLIYGEKESTAEAYATKYERHFAPLSEAPAAPMTGDVNCDGKISVADAVMLARIAAEDTTVQLKAFSQRNADLNGDSKQNAEDTAILLKQIAAYDFPDMIDKITLAEDA